MTSPPPPNPYEPPGQTQPPNWHTHDFREPAQPGVSPLGRGLVGHVPIVATLLLVQGAFEILFALFFLGTFAIFQLSNDKELKSLQPLGVLMAIVSVPAIVCGSLRLVAGYCNFRFQRRLLGMVALCAGLLTMITGYCAPTAIALAIYGLVVYLNDSVMAAFAMGQAGRTPAQIQAAFPGQRF